MEPFFKKNTFVFKKHKLNIHLTKMLYQNMKHHCSQKHNLSVIHTSCSLKTMDTIGSCQRLVFPLGVSQHMLKTKNLWKFELNRSSKLWDINERKKTPLSHHGHTKLCAFRCLILNLRSWNQIRGKLLLSRKLCHFRGSCFSQCFILSISPHYT